MKPGRAVYVPAAGSSENMKPPIGPAVPYLIVMSH